jgi:type IV secretion system protein VirB10
VSCLAPFLYQFLSFKLVQKRPGTPIAGASQISQGGSNLTSSGSQSFTNGAASSVSQSATTILDKFIQIPPTITIREGHRVKVYFTQDMLLPAYENHRIAQSF